MKKGIFLVCAFVISGCSSVPGRVSTFGGGLIATRIDNEVIALKKEINLLILDLENIKRNYNTSNKKMLLIKLITFKEL